MTQEEKQLLLLQDLSARLPYNPKVKYTNYHKNGDDEDIVLNVHNAHKLLVGMDIYHIKPYFRPMSSMTEEEKREFDKFFNWDYGYMDAGAVFDVADWINAHHFDYRGLIEKGLALEAPEGMYSSPIQNK